MAYLGLVVPSALLRVQFWDFYPALDNVKRSSSAENMGIQVCSLLRILFYDVTKYATKLMAVTSSCLNRFSKLFYHWKEKDIENETHVLFPTTP